MKETPGVKATYNTPETHLAFGKGLASGAPPYDLGLEEDQTTIHLFIEWFNFVCSMCAIVIESQGIVENKLSKSQKLLID